MNPRTRCILITLCVITLLLMTPQLFAQTCVQEEYNKVTKQIQERGANPKLVQEECRIARQLGPRLEDQLAALKQSGCVKDPQMGNMIADIVRGHEGDLAMARKTTSRSDCR